MSGPVGSAKGGLGKMGGALKLVGVAGVAAFAVAGIAALKFAGDFDQAFNTIKTGTGATGQELEKLKANFKNVLKDVPASFDDVATATADLNTRLGLTGIPLENMTKQMLEMSRITGTDLSGNITTLTRTMGDWSIGTEDQAESMDKLFKISQATGPSVGEIGNLMVQFGAPLRQFGFGFDEAAALMGKWGKEGVNTELVMGSLRLAIGKFAKDGIPLRKGLDDTFEKIKKLGPGAESTALAMEIFGARAGPDMASTILDGRFAIDDLLGSMEGAEGAILEAGQASMTLGERFGLLKNKILVASEPALTKMLQGLMTALSSVTEFVGGFISSLSSGDVTSSGIFGFGERMGVMAGQVITALKALSTLFVGTFQGDLSKSVGALSKLDPRLQGVADKVIKLAKFTRDDLVPAFQKIAGFIKNEVLPVLLDVGAFMMEHIVPAFITGSTILAKLGIAFAKMEIVVAKKFLPILKAVATWFKNNKPALIAAVSAIGIALLIAFGPVSVGVLAIVGLITLIGLFAEHWEGIKARIIGVLEAIDAATVGKIRSMIDTVREVPVIGEIFDLVMGQIKARVDLVLNLIQNRITFFVDFFTALIKFWKAIFTGEWRDAWDAVKDMMSAVIELIKSDIGAWIGFFKT